MTKNLIKSKIAHLLEKNCERGKVTSKDGKIRKINLNHESKFILVISGTNVEGGVSTYKQSQMGLKNGDWQSKYKVFAKSKQRVNSIYF